MIRLPLLLAFAAALGTNASSAQNLIENPDAEEPIVGGQIPGWTIISGNWRYRGSDPQEFEGDNYFFAGPGSGTPIGETTELRQDVDVAAFAAAIDAGTQPFTFAGYIRAATDEARVVLEYRDGSGVLAIYDSGTWTANTHWQLLRDVRTAPPGTRLIRARLLTTYLEPTNNSGYFDTFTLVADDATPESRFDTSVEAWRVDGDPVDDGFGWVANGGNPGGFIQVIDSNSGILIVWLAPPAFLGDQSARYGGALRFDRIQSTLAEPFTLPDDVRLLGADGTLLLTYDAPPETDPDLTWTAGSVPLSEAGWVNDATGIPATEAEFQDVLADLERVEIVAEYSSAPETNGLDNVVYEGGSVAIEDGPGDAIPTTFALSLAYPNPFNQSTTLSLDLPEAGPVTVDVLDLLGRRVAVLYDGALASGTYTLRFEADRLPGGTYVVRAVSLGSPQTRVVTLAR